MRLIPTQIRHLVHLIVVGTTLLIVATIARGESDLWGELSFSGYSGEQEATLRTAKIIDTPEGWFQVAKLPGGVYGFSEPGHAEKVNSFLVLGGERDLLYDTGMGIANIRDAATRTAGQF